MIYLLLNVKQYEKQAWHPDDPDATCIEWAEKTLKKFVKDEELDKFLLLCGNLEAQCSDSFKEQSTK